MAAADLLLLCTPGCMVLYSQQATPLAGWLWLAPSDRPDSLFKIAHTLIRPVRSQLVSPGICAAHPLLPALLPAAAPVCEPLLPCTTLAASECSLSCAEGEAVLICACACACGQSICIRTGACWKADCNMTGACWSDAGSGPDQHGQVVQDAPPQDHWLQNITASACRQVPSFEPCQPAQSQELGGHPLT